MSISKKMYSLLLVALILSSFGKDPKEDFSPLGKIKTDIEFLASPALKGRLTGTDGEDKAAEYIESRFRGLGISGYKGKYKWDFNANVGVRIDKNAYFNLFNNKLNIGTDVIFLPYGTGNKISGLTMPHVYEQDNVWLVPISDAKVEETNDFQKRVYDYANNCIRQGAASVVFFNDIGTLYDFANVNFNSFESLSKPVALINNKAYLNHLKPNLKKDWIDIDAKLGYENASTTGKNVAAMIDNHAALTIVIAAHYDHIGDGFQGADDNASGVAALLNIAETISKNKLRRYNYLFIAFSGSEQDYQGSVAFLKQNEHLKNAFSCMIDLDMLGRYDASSKELHISGAGTSPTWIPLLQQLNKGYNLRIDSSGIGYSDFSTFYKNNIPSIRVSTGYHPDYLKSSDTPDKINYTGELFAINFVYSLIEELENKSKLVFTKTNDYIPKIESLQSDLGIIPDNSFDKNGIKVAACKPNKMAEKAGIVSGDVISKIGEFIIVDLNDYLEALTKTNKGKETTIIVKRNNNEYKFFVVL